MPWRRPSRSGNTLVGEAFTAGYTSRVRLEPAETAALPELLRLREACDVIHMAGRHRQGLEPLENMRRRVRHPLWLDEWLRSNGGELVECVARRFKGSSLPASRSTV